MSISAVLMAGSVLSFEYFTNLARELILSQRQ